MSRLNNIGETIAFFVESRLFIIPKKVMGPRVRQIVLVSDLVETTNINCTRAKNEQKQRLWEKKLKKKLQHIRKLLALKV